MIIQNRRLWSTTVLLPQAAVSSFALHTAYIIFKEKKPITAFLSACYRLCVCASGSLITDIFSCFTLIKVSCLHFGQNSGKFFSSVSSRIFNLVLLPQTGHSNHSILTISSPISLHLIFGRFCQAYSAVF